MARVRRDVWICDAPLCTTEVQDADGGPALGYEGKVSLPPGVGVKNAPWFACTDDHVAPAVLWVVKVEHGRAYTS